MIINGLSFSGVAVASTRQFFTRLTEDKDDDDPEYYADEGETSWETLSLSSEEKDLMEEENNC